MLRLVFPLLAAALLLGDGLVFGLWTNRWRDAKQMPAAVASLNKVPMVVGDWQGQELPSLNDRTCTIAGFAGHLQRRYEDSNTGTVVKVLLACGPSGPISVHTPEVCFPGTGFKQTGATKSFIAQPEELGAEAQFWTGQFGKNGAVNPGQVRAYWSWNAGGNWQAPDNPRWTFAGVPVLYKLYVTHEVAGGDDQATTERCRTFLRDFVTELENNLVIRP